MDDLNGETDVTWRMKGEQAGQTRTFAALCAASSGERRSPGDARTAGTNGVSDEDRSESRESRLRGLQELFPTLSTHIPSRTPEALARYSRLNRAALLTHFARCGACGFGLP